MILTVNGADFSKAYIGETNGYSVLVSGRGSSNTNWVDKDNDLTMSITINANYTYESLEITVGNNPLNSGFTATHSNGTVSLTIPANLITGVVRIKVNATSTNTGGGTTPPVKPDPEPEQPGTGGGNTDSGTTGNGQWLSVLVTGDKNAHTEFMNYTETIGELTNVPCAYVKPEIQKHLSGKRVTKVACYVLGSNSSISFYTNDYSQSGTTSGDGHWQKVFTLTDPSSKVAAGTKTKKEYNVNFTIEEGDTLAFYDMEKMNSPANKEGLMSYVLPVNYTMNPGQKYGTTLPNFIAFDFYVE